MVAVTGTSVPHQCAWEDIDCSNFRVVEWEPTEDGGCDAVFSTPCGVCGKPYFQRFHNADLHVFYEDLETDEAVLIEHTPGARSDI